MTSIEFLFWILFTFVCGFTSGYAIRSETNIKQDAAFKRTEPANTPIYWVV